MKKIILIVLVAVMLTSCFKRSDEIAVRVYSTNTGYGTMSVDSLQMHSDTSMTIWVDGSCMLIYGRRFSISNLKR